VSLSDSVTTGLAELGDIDPRDQAAADLALLYAQRIDDATDKQRDPLAELGPKLLHALQQLGKRPPRPPRNGPPRRSTSYGSGARNGRRRDAGPPLNVEVRNPRALDRPGRTDLSVLPQAHAPRRTPGRSGRPNAGHVASSR
jgi:hypothetical protein